jgi:hypothetical protein
MPAFAAASTAALAGLWILLSRASAFAPNALPDFGHYTPLFYVPLLAMGSVEDRRIGGIKHRFMNRARIGGIKHRFMNRAEYRVTAQRNGSSY